MGEGIKATFSKTMTVAEQAMFTGISGNIGAIYIDRVKAREQGAADLVSFELAVAGLATTCLARLGGGVHRIGGIALSFPRPVCVGETVEATAELVESDSGRLRCRITCRTSEGAVVVEGHAELVKIAKDG